MRGPTELQHCTVGALDPRRLVNCSASTEYYNSQCHPPRPRPSLLSLRTSTLCGWQSGLYHHLYSLRRKQRLQEVKCPAKGPRFKPELPTPAQSPLALPLFSSLAKLRGKTVFDGSKKRRQPRPLKWTQTLQYRSLAYTTVLRNVSKKLRSSSLQPPRLPGDLDLLPSY